MDYEQEDQFPQGAAQTCCSQMQQMAYAIALELT
jgi:hypothetical protein